MFIIWFSVTFDREIEVITIIEVVFKMLDCDFPSFSAHMKGNSPDTSPRAIIKVRNLAF